MAQPFGGLLLILACKDRPAAIDPVPPSDELAADAHLIRASLAIRGTRPSAADLALIRADPSRVPELVDGYLRSPAFGETAKDMWGELLWVRADTRPVWPATEALAWTTDGAIFTAMSEAPLRLIEGVVVEDRPFSEILTDGRVYADEVLVQVYGLDGWDPAGPPIQALPWTDGRPAAGLLADTALWQRHESNGANFHRGRADRIADLFLCDPIGSRDVDVGDGIDLSDPAAVSDAVRSIPACAACHEALDPLAGHLWGFKGNMRRSGILMSYRTYGCEGPYADWCYPVRFWAPEEVDLWQDNLLPAPDYYGTPVGDLHDLGRAIGADPRFDRCMAQQFGAWMLQVDRDALPAERIDEWSQTFDTTGSARKLVRDIVLSEEFRSTSLLTIRPEQLARLLEDLTGFRYLAEGGCEEGCWDEVDLLKSSLYGFRAMAGGIDGAQVTRPAHGPTPTRHLVMARVANEAAGYVVARDLALPVRSERRLLTAIDPGEIDEERVRTQLVALHDRILGERLGSSDPEIDASLALFSGALERHANDDRAAWTVVIAAMLQDVRMLFY